jgi:adenine-specific DNA-methyltransferase
VTALDGELATIADDDGGTKQVPVGDLLVVQMFGDPAYPTLAPLGSVSRSEERPRHLVVEGENFHALELLAFTHRGQVDCIYIDPPYNTGARDWKYNNSYVDENDAWRHSKWLSFMEKRLRLAKQLLKPDGVLIVTIDENELHHLGVLLEELFPGALRQLVSICINPSGAAGEGLSRVEEYAVFCFLGKARPVSVADDMLIDSSTDSETATHGIRWERLMRGGNAWYRSTRPNLCYPVLLTLDRTRIVRGGDPLEGDEAARPEVLDGHPVAWPLRKDGKLGIWRVQSARLNWLVERGYAYISTQKVGNAPTLRYLLEGTVEAIEAGAIEVTGHGDRGQVLVRPAETAKMAKTLWHRGRHTAGGSGGTQLLNALLAERNVFSFPKSVYATRDCLEVAVGNRPDALILDFFAGSGTTLHAACLLNGEDGGRRRCLLVTNNEVSEQRGKRLRQDGLFPGDPDFERHGIFEAATRPRIEAAITGQRPSGEPAPGAYLDGRSLADGFEENVQFARLDYLDPDRVELGLEWERLHPLLWLLAGGVGRWPDHLDGGAPFFIARERGYAVLLEPIGVTALVHDLGDDPSVKHVFVATDSEESLAQVAGGVGPERTAHMLPRDYLRHCRTQSDRRA